MPKLTPVVDFVWQGGEPTLMEHGYPASQVMEAVKGLLVIHRMR
jgi:sulfatase maturation enzyme AslB (radical SAM superfamily)